MEEARGPAHQGDELGSSGQVMTTNRVCLVETREDQQEEERRAGI